MKSSKICRPRPCFCREALFRPLSSSAAVADHCRLFETSRKERHPTNLTENGEDNIFKPYLFSSTKGCTTLIAFVGDPLLGFSADRDASIESFQGPQPVKHRGDRIVALRGATPDSDLTE